MRTRTVILSVAVLLSLAGIAAGQMQDKSKRPSPPGSATCKFADGKKITVDYSRPRTRDPKTGAARTIMGAVVPYGRVWRTGANEATSFVTEADLTINGTNVPAGSYTLFTIPETDKWTLIINKQTGQWGTDYNQAQDLARIPMKVGKTNGAIEQFTIVFDQPSGNTCTMRLEWENTRASVDIQRK
jgi:hypothetical protein